MWKCITENSLRISGLRGEVQEQMEDGFGEAVLNSNDMDEVATADLIKEALVKGQYAELGSDRTACYSERVWKYSIRFSAVRRK